MNLIRGKKNYTQRFSSVSLLEYLMKKINHRFFHNSISRPITMEAEKQSIGALSQNTSISDKNLSPVSKNDEYREKESNSIEQILQQAAVSIDDYDSDEDEQKKKIAAAKRLLFPSALATSYPEVVDTLRDERRQEFCPIYTDETPEAIAQKQIGRKPIGSLLAKRIRWDDLKRKREDDHRRAQVPVRYGPYGPIYADLQPSFPKTHGQNRSNMPSQPPPSFANPYEQYYTAVQHQYEQVDIANESNSVFSSFSISDGTDESNSTRVRWVLA